MIVIKNLYLKYIREFFALYDINLDIKAGERVAFIGENESGKTSLMRILAKIEKPTKGEVYIKEKPLDKINYAEDFSVGYLPQSPLMFESKTVCENIKYALKVQKCKSSEIEAKLNKALVDFKLECLWDLKVKDISLYEKYLVSIARLSLRDIDLLLIDDIFEKLEPTEIDSILLAIKSILHDNITLIVATENEKVASQLTNRNIYFNLGSLVEKSGKNG